MREIGIDFMTSMRARDKESHLYLIHPCITLDQDGNSSINENKLFLNQNKKSYGIELLHVKYFIRFTFEINKTTFNDFMRS